MEKKFWIQIVALIVLIVIGTYVTKNPKVFNSFLGNPNKFEKIKIRDVIINTEVADTPEKRAKGLGGREKLASDSSMIFIFDNGDYHKFWMKGMKFPLDFIWIKDEKVVDLLINAPTVLENVSDKDITVYQPSEPVNKVLEVNSGFINQYAVSIGDTIREVK